MWDNLIQWFEGINPIFAALVATTFTWFVTAFGAAFVYFFKTLNRTVLDITLGFAGGVMVAASFWSLLNPAIEMSDGSWVPAAIGFILGAFFLFGLDKILPHLHINFKESEAEGPKTKWNKTILLVLAITLHNIPEGLAVGVLFGAVGADLEGASIVGAVTLAIGIGIQNFPEGFAVSMPLRRQGMSRRKSFFYGQLSAVVEPIFGVLGAWAVMTFEPILPYALAFAAGAMIFVVVEEVIPESQRGKNTDLATLGFMVGFVIMMTLDVALG
mgnify:CR=1 FL=1